MIKMKKTLYKGKLIILSIVIASQFIYANDKVVEQDNWTFRLSPYGWLAGFSGDVAGVRGFPITNVDISPKDAFDDSEIALTTMFEGKKNGKGFLLDFMYTNSKAEDAIAGPLILISKTKTIVLSGAYLYEVYNQKRSVVDTYIGLRYWDIDSHMALKGGAGIIPPVNHSEAWIDPFIGIKGRTSFGNTKFYISGGVSIGGFSVNSDLFYDTNVNLGYQWNKSIGTSIGYRIYGLDYNNDGFVYDVKQKGFIFGLTWIF